MRTGIRLIQDISARQIANVLRHKLGKRVHLFTDDGNKITGVLLRVHTGYVTLKRATVVHVNDKPRGDRPKRTVRVATSKIESFQKSSRRH